MAAQMRRRRNPGAIADPTVARQTFESAVSHFCNKLTRGALPRVVVYAQPSPVWANVCCITVKCVLTRFHADLVTNYLKVLYLSIIEQIICCTGRLVLRL
jgi:hypothetical protein